MVGREATDVVSLSRSDAVSINEASSISQAADALPQPGSRLRNIEGWSLMCHSMLILVVSLSRKLLRSYGQALGAGDDVLGSPQIL